MAILTFIKSSYKTKAEYAGEDAFITNAAGVSNSLFNDSDTAAKYNILSMCRRSNQAAFRLDPSRSNTQQHAIAILTAKSSEGFVAEHIQLVSEDDAGHIKNALLMDMSFTNSLPAHIAALLT